MSQYVLVDRPVILSKHKRNVISHGRPLSPLGSLRSVSPYVPRQVVKGSLVVERKHGDNSTVKSTFSVPTVSLVQYQKSAQENLISINNNLSNMLQETFSGIDSICQKVRMCLLEANTVRPMGIPEQLVTPCLQQQLSTCDEEAEMKVDVDNTEQDTDVAEIVEESEEDKVSAGNDGPQEIENTEKPKSLTPFFTILNPKAKSAESVGVKLIKSITSKLGLSQKCTAENFQNSMRKIDELTNYDNFLTTMVDDVKKEIDECYSHCQQVGGDSKSARENKDRDGRIKKDGRPKSSLSERQRANKPDCYNPLKNIHELKKFHRDFNEEHFFENDLISRNSSGRVLGLSSGKMDFTYADVYRKRAITDLHRRMVAQVEANDSFIFFQKLMEKTRKHAAKHRAEITDTDTDCLKTPMDCFPPGGRRGEKRQRSLTDLSKKYQDSLWFSQKRHEAKRAKKGHKKRDKNPSQKEKCLPQSYTVQSALTLRGKPRSMKRPSEERCGNSCALPSKCRMSVTNNQPLSDSEKCKIQWMRVKSLQLSHKKLKHLDILDDITKNDLIPLKPEYPRRDEVVKIDDVKSSYLYKLMYGKGKENKEAWNELFEPNLKCSKENCKKCSNVSLPKAVEARDKDEVNTKKPDLQTNPSSSRGHVFRILSKYIFSELPRADVEKNIFTVMPVHVFYDNPRMDDANRKPDGTPQRLPLLPMKETKGVRKAEWAQDNSKKPKPMKVVYDPILRKIEKEIRLVTARHENRTASPKLVATTSWSPRNFNQYCTPTRPTSKHIKIDHLDKVAQKQQQKPPVASANSPAVAEIYKRSGSEQVNNRVWNFSNTAHRKELQTNDKIQKDIEAQVSRQKNDQDRKIWENKYGKSVGQKLLNFIEKQPNAYQIPVPKYALPRPVKDTARQQKMLEQLRTLKHKNDSIQNNIQRAIEVIENKMVDLLCKPTTTESIEAFDEMEKEITNVLSMMKAPNQDVLKKKDLLKTVNSCSEVDQISDELFRKLDKILESPGLTSSGRSSKSSLTSSKRVIKEKRSRSPEKSVDMDQVCFSATSASGEEKFTITAISPKRYSKNPAVPPFAKTDESTEEELASINSEIRKLRNELKLHEGSEVMNTHTLEAIQETDTTREHVSAIVVVNQKKIVPVQEQVINLALVNSANEQSSGDQLRETSNLQEYSQKSSSDTDQEDELTYSIGDGDSVIQSTYNSNAIRKEIKDNDISPLQPDELEINSAPATAEEQQIPGVSQDTEAVNKQPPNVVESSEPYFTPLSSPMRGTRESERAQAIVPPKAENTEEIAEGKEDVLPVKETEAAAPTNVNETQGEKIKDNDEEGSDKDYFYQNINKIISRVESVYSQLEEFEEEMKSEELIPPKVAVFQDPPKRQEPVETDEFLTPFMHAVKDLRKTTETRKSSPRLYKSPSYFNVLSFLDTLTDFREEHPIEVHTSRFSLINKPKSVREILCLKSENANDPVQNCPVHGPCPRVVNSAHLCHIPITFRQSFIRNQCVCSSSELAEVPKKKSGCLKNPSSHMNMNTTASKSKQKVSFLLQKEEKAVQVTACPFHTAVKIMSDHKASSDTSTQSIPSTKKDEQVSAYLDALENKSVDKMSLLDDETCQSSFEFTDEISSDKQQMPEQLIQNVQKDENRKNVVEIFRNSSSEERGREKIKVFYDNYQQGQNTLDRKLISGFYNESSLLQVKQSLSKDIAVKRRNSLEKLLNSPDWGVFLKQLKESSLLEPLKNLNDFIDSKLLKEAIEQRQNIRMIRRKSASRLISEAKEQIRAENSNGTRKERTNASLLKSVYVFVYLLMFTALNLDYKCVY